MELNMVMGPETTIDRHENNWLDRRIVAVERGASDLRRGVPVVIGGGHEVLLVQSAELLSDLWIALFCDIGFGDPVVGLTHNRANILHIPPTSGSTGGMVSLIKLSKYMDSAVIQSMADPADDLMYPLLGPFYGAEKTANSLHSAGLKLCKIARLLPAALFSASFSTEEGEKWAEDRNFLYVRANDVLNYDLNDAAALKKVTAAKVPLAGAERTTIVAFRPDDGGTEHFALIIGDPNRHDPVLTRIHSECFTGDLLGSLKCDCGDQLRGAIKHMQNLGGGVLLYLAQEGRGIGLINKLRAYRLQDQGFDTVDANERLGFQSDERIFEPAAQMLKILGFSKVRLLTNNPLKVSGLESCGIEVTERVEHHFPSNIHNDHYLQTKKNRSGHLLS